MLSEQFCHHKGQGVVTKSHWYKLYLLLVCFDSDRSYLRYTQPPKVPLFFLIFVIFALFQPAPLVIVSTCPGQQMYKIEKIAQECLTTRKPRPYGISILKPFAAHKCDRPDNKIKDASKCVSLIMHKSTNIIIEIITSF